MIKRFSLKAEEPRSTNYLSHQCKINTVKKLVKKFTTNSESAGKSYICQYHDEVRRSLMKIKLPVPLG